MSIDDFTVRAYREGDEVEVNHLFNEIFGTSRSLDEWRWKFCENPTGVMVIAVAESGGRIVGQYAAITAFFHYLDKVVPVTVSVDNFVIPRFRGGIRGVQKALYDLQNLLWPRALAFGFPNRAAHIVGKRILKYREVGKMPVLFRRLSFRSALSNRMPWLPPYALSVVRSASNLAVRAFTSVRAIRTAWTVRTRIVSSFDARIDALWERVKTRNGVICVRDRRYLDWRYSKPGASYHIVIAEKGDEVVGYAVTGAKDDPAETVGYIVDLVADDTPGALAALVRHSILDLLARKADYALCWMLQDKAAFRVLQEAGFAQKEAAFPPVNIAYKIYDPQAVDEEFVGNVENWFLTMGDSDVY